MQRRELTFRVFVSSTFSDLIAERNALHEHVFPRLREYCQKHGAQFQAIDLRWGISSEASLDQSTIRICRAEIARCQAVTPRPNFVIILGDRYGWRPLPDVIPAAEFDALLPHLPAVLARRWYKLDENAVCHIPEGFGIDKGQYVLQSRDGEYKDYDKWFDEVEGPLGDALRRTSHKLGLPDAARIKYEASATAQEIYEGAFASPEAREHVLVFARDLRTADGRPLREELPCDAAVKDYVDLKKYTCELDHESQYQLDALKRRLHKILGPERFKTYSARWEGNGTSNEHIPRFCVDVYRSLLRLIHTQIKCRSALPPIEQEQLHHQEFVHHCVYDFTGQAGPLAEIDRYLSLSSEPAELLLVHGASGSGKSALLAKVVADQQTRFPDHKLIFRFIGATATSTDPRSLLEGLCRELGVCYGVDNTDLPLDLNELKEVFRQRLGMATEERPLALFLDGLDQLQVADCSELSWLPKKLPSHVHLVLSAIPGPVQDFLRKHLSFVRSLGLGPMHPEDAAELLQKWLQRAGRRITSVVQRQAIWTGFTRCGLPLYLRLVFEEAQRWHSYDQPPPPSPDVDGLIKRFFDQLSKQLHHDPILVERAISYLRCSRYGLTEDEILDLLTIDEEYWCRFLASAHHALPVTDGQRIRRLPIVIWSRLYHDLEPYLVWRSADGSAVMTFFHARFNEVADRQFLKDSAVSRARHDDLATYFHSQYYFLESVEEQRARARQFPPTPRIANLRKVNELPWQRLETAKLSGDWHIVAELFTDLFFLEAKTEAGLVFDLARNFISAANTMPKDWPQRRIILLLEEALRRDIQFIVRHPTTLFQCMWNTCWWYDSPTAKEHYVETEEGSETASPWNATGEELHTLMENWRFRKKEYVGFFWLRNRRPPSFRLGCGPLAILRRPNKENSDTIESVVYSPDGSAIATGSREGVITIWDDVTTQCRQIIKTKKFAGHGLTWSPDGTKISNPEGIWDVNTGNRIFTFPVHHVNCLSWSPKNDLIAIGSDCALLIWRLEQKELIVVSEDAPASFDVIAWSPDGVSFATSCSMENYVRIWDVASRSVLRSLEGHRKPVTSLSWSPDGKSIASGSYDCEVRVWDARSGECLKVLSKHREIVNCVAWSPDSSLIASGSGTFNGADNSIRIWSINSIRPPRMFRFSWDEGFFVSLSWHPSGERIASGSMSPVGSRLNALSVWGVTRLESDLILKGHPLGGMIDSVNWTRDGMQVLTCANNLTGCLWDVSTGICLWCKNYPRGYRPADSLGVAIIDGRGSDKETSLSFTTDSNYSETQVVRTTDGKVVGWWPEPLRWIIIHPTDPFLWAAVAGLFHFCLLQGQTEECTSVVENCFDADSRSKGFHYQGVQEKEMAKTVLMPSPVSSLGRIIPFTSNRKRDLISLEEHLPLWTGASESVMIAANYGLYRSTCIMDLPHELFIFTVSEYYQHYGKWQLEGEHARVRSTFLKSLPAASVDIFANGCVWQGGGKRALLLFDDLLTILDTLFQTGTRLSAFAGFTGTQLRWDYSGRALRINDISFLKDLLRVSGNRMHFYTDCTPELISMDKSKKSRHRWYKPLYQITCDHGRYQFALNGALVLPYKVFVDDCRPDLRDELLYDENKYRIVHISKSAANSSGDQDAGGLWRLLPLRMWDGLEIIAHYDVERLA